MEPQPIERPRLWISYPWVNNEERDFAYLIPQLREANIDATLDSIQLMPDTCLWQRIMQRLLSIGFDGWLYILTHQCFTRKAFTDGLTVAIDQTLLHKGPDFPMVGLLYGIANHHVPAVLRGLPCISLGDPDWKHKVFEALKRDAPAAKSFQARKERRFVWNVHSCWGGDPSMTAVEVHTRGQTIPHWRFAIPKSFHPLKWGQGPTGGDEISRMTFSEAKGSGRYEGSDITWFGAADVISHTVSAYALFAGPLPDFICFGPAQSALGPPGHMEILWPNLIRQN
jgi:hypothetical protein